MTSTDHEGQTLNVGDNVWIPATITNILSSGAITANMALGVGAVTVPGPNTHKNKPTSFPDLP